MRPDFVIELGEERLCLADAAVVLAPAAPGAHFSGSDVVPALRVVALPKAVVNKDLKRPDGAAKATLLLSRDSWKGGAAIHSQDLPWLLAVWLREGSLGVPADAQSGSQDFFLRLSGGVAGFALKAASASQQQAQTGASAGTNWSDVREELSKAPKLPASTPYSLVLWSLNLAPQLRPR